MRSLAIAVAALSLLVTPLAAHQPAAPPLAVAEAPALAVAFEGGLWFDGAGFVPARYYAVGGRLTARRPERIDATVNLRGRYLLPSLIEAHNHDMQNGFFGARSNAKNMALGVFHSVQMCSKPEDRAAFSGFLGQPGTVEVLYADACISGSDGHPLGIALASARQAGMEVSAEEARRGYDPIDTLEELERVWPTILAREPKLIKFILINSQRRSADLADPATFGFRGLDPALARPIVERAHAAGIRVVAHADSAADFEIALEAGVDMVAHLPGYRIAKGMSAADYRLSDRAIAQAALRGTVVITTAVAATHDMSRRPHNAEALRAMQIENLTRLRAAGVPLAIGSDDVMGSVVDEILYLDGLTVMPRAELLRRATADTARAMFPERPIGRFAEGAEASLVAYVVNPLERLDVLRTPALRIQRGAVLAR